MIYTLTISPSLDFINEVQDFNINKINRSHNSFFIPGGKGINVSVVLKELGIDSIAMGFKAGFTGEYLIELLTQKNINNDLIKANGLTRVNVKVIGNIETAINTDMLIINNENINLLISKIKKIKKDDVLIISGNIPSSMSQDLYEILIKEVDRNVKIVVDAESKLLLNTLKYNPFLIKPNRDELGQIFNTTITTVNEAMYYAEKLQELGARNVIVSLDKDGAILVDVNKEHYILRNIEGKVVSSVGAGDSLIAGFVYGIQNDLSYKDSFMMGVACANTTAFSATLADKSSIYKNLLLLKEINN